LTWPQRRRQQKRGDRNKKGKEVKQEGEEIQATCRITEPRKLRERKKERRKKKRVG
jgi:hypothetical protein